MTGHGKELGGSFALGAWRVRRAGYGAMQLSGDGVFGPPRDRDEALRVLRAAAAARVDHIDTAQFYGAGTVNELIREALHPYPDDLAIGSKVGVPRDAGSAVLRPNEARELRLGIEDNLRALGTGRLAAVNLRMMDPSPSPGRRFDAQLAVLVLAREEGLIDGIGLSNVSRAQLLRAVAQTEIVCVQNLFNLADQRSIDVLDECRARNIAFVPFCPLGWPGQVRQQLLGEPVLAAVGDRLGATPVQVMLAWLLDLAPNILLIPGTRARPSRREPGRRRRPARRRGSCRAGPALPRRPGHPTRSVVVAFCLDRLGLGATMPWQVQDAKQRFSELIRKAHSDGPQVVTRHGEEIAVVIDIADYRRLKGETAEFKDYLRAGPAFDELDLDRPADRPRSIDLADEA